MKGKGVLFSALLGAALGAAIQRERCRRQQAAWKENGDKYFYYFQLLNRWMIGRQEGKRAADFLREEGMEKIAIYGMGDLANRLAEELQGSDVHVLYGIDRDVCCTNSRIAEVYSPEDALPEVDGIVITPFRSLAGIKRLLEERCPYRLLSLEDIIYSL